MRAWERQVQKPCSSGQSIGLGPRQILLRGLSLSKNTKNKRRKMSGFSGVPKHFWMDSGSARIGAIGGQSMDSWSAQNSGGKCGQHWAMAGWLSTLPAPRPCPAVAHRPTFYWSPPSPDILPHQHFLREAFAWTAGAVP